MTARHSGLLARRAGRRHAAAHADRLLDAGLAASPTCWSSGRTWAWWPSRCCNGLYNSYVLLAVPLFVFAANIMNAGTVSERIFDFCRILVGRLRGGLAQVDILVSVIFSGMSGSAIADAAGPGLVTIRQMLKKPEYSPRLCRRGGGGQRRRIGPIIPPSIPMVIYALVSGASVGALFLGGVVPGLLMAGADDGRGARHRRRSATCRARTPVPLREWPAHPVARRAAAVACRSCCWAASTPARSRPPKRRPWRRCTRWCWPAWCTARSSWRTLLRRGAGVDARAAPSITHRSWPAPSCSTTPSPPKACRRRMAQWVDGMHLSPAAVPAAGQRAVPGAGLLSRRVGAAAGVCADAAAGGQGCWASTWCTSACWWCST